MTALVLLLACAKTSGLGQQPAAPVAAPDFHATNRDGTPRDRSALLGHPTVLWFYPAAETPG